MDMGTISLFLAGDVMTGRGVDQVLPHPVRPELHEEYIRDARSYVALAERANGAVPAPVGWDWPWGDALEVLDAVAPDVRLVNLETSVTRSEDFAPGKGIHYRMSPENVAVLTAARIDGCTLANNHVLDFGRRGLRDTLDTLHAAGIRTGGAGADEEGAWAPAVVNAPAARVLVWSAGLASSGIAPDQAAGAGRAGVAYLPDLSAETADRLLDRIHGAAGLQPEEVNVVSLHWGTNWGYAVPDEQVAFAHRLLDGGVDVVFGHSSHHARPLEIHRGRPVFYGCGDLVNDYEGIAGYEGFRDELRLLHFATLDLATRTLSDLTLVPVRARRLRLERAGRDDARWLLERLNEAGARFRTRLAAGAHGAFSVGLA